MEGQIDLDARAEGLSFRTLCESSAFGFWQIDTEGRTVYLNAAMCALLELDSPEQLGSETYHRFFSPESLERMRSEHAKRASGGASTYEVELIGMRGGRRNLMISGAPLHDGQGALLGLIGTFMDITERKSAELMLEGSERRLRSLFETSVDAIGVSQAGVHIMANPAYLRMFGYDDEAALVGRPIFELLAPSEHTRIADLVQRRSGGNDSPNHYLTRGLRKNGEEFPLEVHVSSYDERGVLMTVAVLRDVSERLRLEERLRQSQKMDALGRLAGGVAHDFNNLLMVMMGCADLLLADPTGSESVRTHARLIQDTGERASSLTRQLLALSRSQVM
ncbi:MAG TPA: PAS domain S-box protein, partial [Polyangiales bacterium]